MEGAESARGERGASDCCVERRASESEGEGDEEGESEMMGQKTKLAAM